MQTEKIRVEKLIHGGFGLAREAHGKIIFLRDSLPGEEMTYTSTATTTSHVFATPKTILAHHPERISPPCSYYGQCGGCNLQFCNYDGQLVVKTRIFKDLLHKSKVPYHGDITIIPSPAKLHYRQRIRLKTQHGKLGFSKFRSRNIVPVDSCLLAELLINNVLTLLQKTHQGEKLIERALEVELLFHPANNQIILYIFLQNKPRKADRKKAAELKKIIPEIQEIFFSGKNFAMQSCDPALQNTENKMLCDHYSFRQKKISYSLCWEAGGFCQVNLQQNRNIISFLLDTISDDPPEHVLDLYCGMGNFSIPLSFFAQSVTGVENQSSAIRSANKNKAANNLENLIFIRGSSNTVCSDLTGQHKRFDLTIIDPPRKGIIDHHSEIAALTENRIIYISCDPATLLRDCKIFAALGFHLDTLQLFDMFPQTHHIETMAILKKK